MNIKVVERGAVTWIRTMGQNRRTTPNPLKTKARSGAACILIMHEQRKLVYGRADAKGRESLRALEYKEFRCGLMVDNVVNWYMGERKA